MQFEEAENEQREEEEKSLDLLEIFELIRGKILWIVAFAMLGATLAYAFSSFFITPLYSSSAILYVNNQKTMSYQNEISTNALTVTARLVPTYQAIIATRTAMRRAIDEFNIEGYTPDELLAMLSTDSGEDTGVFSITVTGKDQYRVAEIATAIAEVSTSEISRYVEGTTASIIDAPRVPENKSYPSNKRNTLIGAALGGLLCAAYIVAKSFLDVRIKRTEDFSKFLNAPVLGVIPNMASAHASNGRDRRANKDRAAEAAL